MKAKSKKVFSIIKHYYNLYYNDIPVLLDDSNCI